MNWLDFLPLPPPPPLPLPHLGCCACWQYVLYLRSISFTSVCFIATLVYHRRYLVKCILIYL